MPKHTQGTGVFCTTHWCHHRTHSVDVSPWLFSHRVHCVNTGAGAWQWLRLTYFSALSNVSIKGPLTWTISLAKSLRTFDSWFYWLFFLSEKMPGHNVLQAVVAEWTFLGITMLMVTWWPSVIKSVIKGYSSVRLLFWIIHYIISPVVINKIIWGKKQWNTHIDINQAPNKQLGSNTQGKWGKSFFSSIKQQCWSMSSFSPWKLEDQKYLSPEFTDLESVAVVDRLLMFNGFHDLYHVEFITL